MSTFEFVVILLSIVVGLGITRLLSALASLVEHRDKVRFDALTLVWVANAMLFHIFFWWVAVGNARAFEQWSLAAFLVLFAYAMVLFFSAALILPSNASAGCDLRDRYDSIRRPFFALMTAAPAIDVTDSLLKGGIDRILNVLGPTYIVAMTGMVLFGIGAMRTADRRIHWIGAITLFAATIGSFVRDWSVLQ
jgi:hypothetical protein